MSGSLEKKRPWEDVFASQNPTAEDNRRTREFTQEALHLTSRDKANPTAAYDYYSVRPVPAIAAQSPGWSTAENTLPPLSSVPHVPVETLRTFDSYIESRRPYKWDEQPGSNNRARRPSNVLLPPTTHIVPAEYPQDSSLRSFRYRNLYNPIRDDMQPTSTSPPRSCSMASLLTTDVDVPSPISAISNSVESSIWKMSSGHSRRLSSAPSTNDEPPSFSRVRSKDTDSPRFRLGEDDKQPDLRSMVEQLFRKDAELERLREECQALKSHSQATEHARSEQITSQSLPLSTEGGTASTIHPDDKSIPDIHSKVLAELQHKISKQSLELKTLQTEHDNLLAAFSRSQTRSATLQKKCEVAAAETSSLSADKERLQDEKEILQNQYNEMVKQRDDYRRQAVAGGGQYTNIVDMASRLEMSAVTERKRWKEEKDDLQAQLQSTIDMITVLNTKTAKDEIQIRNLENELSKLRLVSAEAHTDNLRPPTLDDNERLTAANSSSSSHLYEENDHLRNRVSELERLLKTSAEESQQVVILAQAIQLRGADLAKKIVDSVSNKASDLPP